VSSADVGDGVTVGVGVVPIVKLGVGVGLGGVVGVTKALSSKYELPEYNGDVLDQIVTWSLLSPLFQNGIQPAI
jgi:hypothetical protein